MSASIYWQPVKGKTLDIPTPSSFIDAMSRAGLGVSGQTLRVSDIPVLKGIAAAREDWRDALSVLIDAIYEHEEVRIWSEF